MTQKLIVNCTTGERSVVDYTDEEEAAATAAAEAQLAADTAAKAADRSSPEELFGAVSDKWASLAFS